MHIPDGSISPSTSLAFLGAMVPLWSITIRKIKTKINYKQMPLLALCAAFSFVIMMFNIPFGGSSVHAVGAVFIAIMLGPWAACIAISVALLIQAVLFGDGGIMALGANCFNMAFAMPFAGYYIYKIINGNAIIGSKRNMIGIFIGSYIGINVAAFLTAVEFGIQPLLFQSPGGTPLYNIFPLWVSIPMMMTEHLFIAGPIEGIVTLSAVTYLVKFSPHLFNKTFENEALNEKEKGSFFSRYKAFIIGLLVLLVLTPLGLIATGTAWGEWGLNEIKGMTGFIPEGFNKFSDLWNALIPDYSVLGLDKGFFQSSIGYIVSAIVGVLVISVIMVISSKAILKREE